MHRKHRPIKACAALSALFATSLFAQTQPNMHFDLPKQALADSLRAIGSQANINILFDPPLISRWEAPALKEDLTTDQAISRLLKGTGIRYEILNEHTIVLTSPMADSETAVGQKLSWRRLAQVYPSSAEDASSPSNQRSRTPAEPGRTVQEIVVTATRREQSLQEVPVSVSAINSEGLAARGISSLFDFTPGTVPGLILQQAGGEPSTLEIGMRGVAIEDPNVITSEMPVPVYIDGIYLGRAQGMGLDLIEPERVEVLRGPQGQLFGRNAEGGVIQYVSRKPSGEFKSNLSASYGNYAAQRYRGSVDLPQWAGFSTQFSAGYAEHDPYTKNGPKGAINLKQSDYSDLKGQYGLRGAVRWKNDSGLIIDYSYDYSKSKHTSGYLTWQPVNTVTPATFVQPPSSDFPNSTYGPIYNDSWVSSASGHGLFVTYKASDSVTLKSISAYRKASLAGGTDYGWALLAGVSSSGFIFPGEIEATQQKQMSQEFQLIGTWDQFDLTAGAIYYDEKPRQTLGTILSGPGLVGPVTFVAPTGLAFCVDNDPCLAGRTMQHVETKSYGVYSQGTYRPKAVQGLELTLGLRYTDDNKDARRTYDISMGGPVDRRSKFSASRVDPAATIKYNWTNDFNTYLRYATGYRAGGATTRSATFSSFDEEEIESWELGAKSVLLEHRLSLNAALYQNTIKGKQITYQVNPTVDPNLTETVNSPKDQKIKGAELEINWLALDDLNVGLSFAYMDEDKYQDTVNPFTSVVTRFYSLQAPKTSGSIAVDYKYRKLPVGQMAYHVDYSYADDYWVTPGAIPVSTLLPNYTRPTAKASQLASRLAWQDIRVGEGTFELAVWGKNLLDDHSIRHGFDGCAFGGGFCSWRYDPRTYGVEVRYNIE